MAQHHIIKQQLVHIEAGDATLANEMFTQTSRLFNHRIQDISAELFDKVADEQTLIRIETLEVDMGLLSFPFSEEEFAETYRKTLMHQLQLKIKQLEEGKGDTDGEEQMESTVKLSLMDLLKHYLLTGTIAWWASGNEMKNPVLVFEKVYASDAAALTRLLQELIEINAVRKRIVFNFEEEQVKQVIQLLEPAESVFIIAYHKNLSTLQLEQRFVNAENDVFKKALWLFILDFLANEEGSRFNKKMFVKSTLRALAARFNMNFEKVLFYFTEAISSLPDLFLKSDNLPALVNEISEEHVFEQAAMPVLHNGVFAAGIADFTGNETEPEILFFFLLYGYLPLHFNPKTREQLAEQFVVLSRQRPAYLKAVLEKYAVQSFYRKRIITDLGEEAVRSTIVLAEPAGAETILNYADFTFHLQRKKNIVKTEEKNFRQSLWKIILDFLFADRGSVFSARVFLESNIRAVARHYNMEFKMLLVFLVQATGEEQQLSQQQTQLFYMLTEILRQTGQVNMETHEDKRQTFNELSENVLPEPIEGGIKKENEAEDPATVKVKVRNALLFWFEKGELPEWIKYKFKDEETFLSFFLTGYKSEVRELFHYAFLQQKVFYGFFHRFSITFEVLMKHFPGGEKALSFLKFILSGSTFSVETFTSAEQKTLLNITLAETLLQTSEGNFDEKLFLRKLLYRMRIALPPANFISLQKDLKSVLDKYGNKGLLKVLDEKNFEVQQHVNEAHFSEQDMLHILSGQDGAEMVVWNSLLEQKAVQWMLFFLKNKKLPEDALRFSVFGTERFVRFLLILFAERKPELIKQLLGNPAISAEERFRFFEFISIERIRENQGSIREFLISSLENSLKDLLSSHLPAEEISLKRIVDVITGLNNRSADVSAKPLIAFMLRTQVLRTFVAKRLTTPQFDSLVKNLGFEKHSSFIKNLMNVFALMARDSFEREQLMIWLREFFLEAFIAERYSGYSPEQLLGNFIRFLAQQKQLNMAPLIQQLKKTVSNSSVTNFRQVNDIIDWVYNETSGFVKNEEAVAKMKLTYAGEEKKMMEQVEEEIAGLYVSDEAVVTVKAEEEKHKDRDSKKIMEGEQIYISNAGLVLLHPFLSTLFTRCGFTDKGIFKDEEKKTRAALLLQYVVKGEEGAKEEELALNKILCGIEMQESLEDTGYMLAEEKNTADGMLNAVMQQWDKMKNTSVENFRASFLMRDGYLVYTPEAWVLRIEQRGYDILLQTLPWSFGMIKFSWMNIPLIVEWT